MCVYEALILQNYKKAMQVSDPDWPGKINHASTEWLCRREVVRGKKEKKKANLNKKKGERQ